MTVMGFMSPNVYIETYWFSQPNIDGGNVGYIYQMLTLKYTVLFAAQCCWEKHWVEKPHYAINNSEFKIRLNVDMDVGCKHPQC
jgi:hypothetical protein